MTTTTDLLATDPHTPWSGDPWHQTRTPRGSEFHLIKHDRRDGHVNANGHYLSCTDLGIDRYYMGVTPKRGRERFHLEFVEGWQPTHRYGRGGQELFERGGRLEPFADLLFDLRNRVVKAQRAARQAAKRAPAVAP